MSDALFIFCILWLSLFHARLTYGLVYEKGAWGVFALFRKTLGIRMESKEEMTPIGIAVSVERAVADNVLGDAFTCFDCASIWVAAFPSFIALALYHVVFPAFYTLPFLAVMACWGMTVLSFSALAMLWKRLVA